MCPLQASLLPSYTTNITFENQSPISKCNSPLHNYTSTAQHIDYFIWQVPKYCPTHIIQHSSTMHAPLQHSSTMYAMLQHSSTTHALLQHSSTMHALLQHSSTMHALLQHSSTTHALLQHSSTTHALLQHSSTMHALLQHSSTHVHYFLLHVSHSDLISKEFINGVTVFNFLISPLKLQL